MSTLKFRVVGVYFGSKGATTGEVSIDTRELPEGGNNDSVRDIMAAISRNARNGQYNGVAEFTFGSRTHGSLSSVTVAYTHPPKPNSRLQPGLYGLEESFRPGEHMPNYTVWQYYIYDENLQQVNFQTQAPYPNFTVKNPFGVDWNSQNYTIVWRLVSITQAPVRILETSKQGIRLQKMIEAASKS